MYTNHGQKLVLPDFVDMPVEAAKTEAEKETFQIIVNDSVHIIGKPGGIIIDQNPKPDSKVKENRKIYVTTTKYVADQIKVAGLPSLYGRDFERKSKELSFMDINSTVKDYIYDPGEPNHILEVYYNGQQIISKEGRQEDVKIEKGGTLEFVLSKRYGGEMSIPDVECMDYESAFFLIENLKLKVGKIIPQGEISDQSTAYIVSQFPIYDPEGLIKIGDEIELTISQAKPANCN
jgi:beta-lactam-binding protein with PASTA domain